MTRPKPEEEKAESSVLVEEAEAPLWSIGTSAVDRRRVELVDDSEAKSMETEDTNVEDDELFVDTTGK